MKKRKQYADIDHANKQLDRVRVNLNRASMRHATQRQAAASMNPPGAADLPPKMAAPETEE